MFSGIKIRSCVVAVLGSAILAFGLYNVHSLSGVTEGGVLGLTLLLQHVCHISPAISGLVLNVCCYALGFRTLGRTFLVYSFIATVGFSGAYKICEWIGPLFPQIAQMPLLASIVGALFVGVGAGVCVRIGGAPSGDDALAMSLSHLTHIRIQWIYLLSDLTVLGLSLIYIPFRRIIFSLLTVILSGQLIGIVQKVSLPKKR